MKVLVVNNHMKSHLGGSELQCHLLSSGLSNKGHEVIYLAPDDNLSADFGDLNYKVVTSKDTGDQLAKAILEISPDVIYWRRDKKNIYRVAKAAKKANIPFVFAVSHISNLKLDFGNPKRNLRDVLSSLYWHMRSAYELRAIAIATYVTVLNPDLLSLVPHKHVRFIANSVPRDVVSFYWPRPYIVWVASIKPEKRPEEVLALSEALKEHGVDIIMVGEIQHKAYSSMMNISNLPDNVFYLGKKSVEEVNGILQRSLFHIHTCLPEGFGNIFIQAWAARRGSVSLGYDPGGYLNKYKIGFDANNDKLLFRETVLKLVLNPEERERLGRNALDVANQLFTTDRMVSEIEDLLHQAITLSDHAERVK